MTELQKFALMINFVVSISIIISCFPIVIIDTISYLREKYRKHKMKKTSSKDNK